MERQMGAAAPRWSLRVQAAALGFVLVVLVWELIDLWSGKAGVRDSLGTFALCLAMTCSGIGTLATDGRPRLRNALVAAALVLAGAALVLMVAQ